MRRIDPEAGELQLYRGEVFRVAVSGGGGKFEFKFRKFSAAAARWGERCGNIPDTVQIEYGESGGRRRQGKHLESGVVFQYNFYGAGLPETSAGTRKKGENILFIIKSAAASGITFPDPEAESRLRMKLSGGSYPCCAVDRIDDAVDGVDRFGVGSAQPERLAGAGIALYNGSVHADDGSVVDGIEFAGFRQKNFHIERNLFSRIKRAVRIGCEYSGWFRNFPE